MSNVSRASHFLLVAVGVLFAGASSAATVSRTILNDGGTVALYNPAIAVDDDGVLHIAAQGRVPDDSSTTEIYYLSLDGSTVRAAVPVNTVDTSNEGRPKIAVTAAGKVIVTWAGNGQSMQAVLLDPAAAPASLIEIAETTIGANTGGGHHALAIDGNGMAHVVRANTTNMLHIRFNPATLVPDVAEHAIGTTSSSNRQIDPGLDIDSNNRLHVVYSAEDIDGQGPAAYMMLNDDGTIRIAPTALFERAGVYAHAAHLSLMVQSPERVHIVYGDKRDTLAFGTWSEYKSGGTSFYTRLDPSDDDQDGDAATLVDITIGEEQTVGGYWYGQAFLRGSTVHFLTGAGMPGAGNLLHVNISGGSVGSPRVIEANNGGFSIGKKYVRGAGNHVVWAEEIYSPTLVGGSTQLVRASLSSVAGGGGGGGGLPVGTLALFAGLALARQLSRRVS